MLCVRIATHWFRFANDAMPNAHRISSMNFFVVLSFNLFSYLSFFGLRWKAWKSLVEQICDGKHVSVCVAMASARRTEKYTSKLKININYSDWMAVSRRSWPNNKLRGETSIRNRVARTWIEFNRLLRDGLTQPHSQLKCLRKMPDTASLWDFVLGFARCRQWCVQRRPNEKRGKIKSKTQKFQVRLIASVATKTTLSLSHKRAHLIFHYFWATE